MSDKDSTGSPKLPPPIMEVTVSSQDEDDGLYNPAALDRPGQTNIFISPHYVPQMSPHKVNNMSYATGETPSSKASSSYSGVPISPTSDGPLELASGSAVVKQYSYDAEESCLLTDGVPASPSDPLADDYDGLNSMLPQSSPNQSNGNERKIMVVRPYRTTPDESITSPTSVLSSPRRSSTGSPWDEESDVGAKRAQEPSRENLYASSKTEYSSKTSSWSHANQKARSATLTRARELLRSNEEYLDSPQVHLSGKPPYLGSPDRVKQRLFKNGNGLNDVSYDQDLEDGLAALGPGISTGAKRSFHPDMLTNRPEEYLREIYEEASRCMKV